VSLQKLYEQYESMGLVVIGLNTSDDEKIVREHLKLNKMTFPIILDTSEKAWKVHDQYETLGMTAVPLTYLIDRDGKIVTAWYGYGKGLHEAALKQAGF